MPLLVRPPVCYSGICAFRSVLTTIHRISLGTGRPITLRDENYSRLSRVLLNHPMGSPTDVRLISLVELVAQKGEFLFFSVCRVGHLTFILLIWCSSNLRDSGTS